MFFARTIFEALASRSGVRNPKILIYLIFLNAALVLSTVVYMLFQVPWWLDGMQTYGFQYFWSSVLLDTVFYPYLFGVLVFSATLSAGTLLFMSRRSLRKNLGTNPERHANTLKNRHSVWRRLLESMLRAMLIVHVVLLALGLLDLLLLVTSVVNKGILPLCPWNYMLGDLSHIPLFFGFYGVVDWMVFDWLVQLYLLFAVFPLLLISSVLGIALRPSKTRSLLLLTATTSAAWSLLWFHNAMWLRFMVGEGGCFMI